MQTPTVPQTPQANGGSSPARRWGRIAVVVILLAALGAQGFWAAATNSATADEPEHIGCGLAALRTGDFRLSATHPPLVDMLSALPVAAAGAPPLPLNSEYWHEARRFPFTGEYFWRGPADGPRLTFLGRLPIILISMGLALLVFVWARRLYGWLAGALALALYCFEPNLLAYSSLATNDLGAAAGFALSVYTYWRYLRAPSRLALALAGIGLGVALLAKFSTLLLLPVLLLMAVVYGVAVRRLSPLRLAGGLAAIVAVSAMVIWAGYGFGVQPRSRSPDALRLPAGQFLAGVRFRVQQQTAGHPAYLMGQTSTAGWWYYFPVAFLVKTPLPLLLLLGIAMALRRFTPDEAFLAVPAAIFFVAAASQNLNYGLRHILPIYPLLVIFAARVVARPWPVARPLWGRAAVGALAVWMVVEALLYAPQYIPYFNELAGGPAGGHRYLADANLDWGQDLRRLAHWQQRHPDRSPLYLSYFGPGDPTRYGVRAEPLPGFSPNWPPRPMPDAWYRDASKRRAGWIAVSVNSLKLNLGQLTGKNMSYSWLAFRKPVARAGYSIWIYHIPQGSVPDRAVTPGPPQDPGGPPPAGE